MKQQLPYILARSLVFVLLVCALQPLLAEDGVRVGHMDASKILFLGNSLTYHPSKPEIGWTGDWGMAASSADKDYAHLVASAVAAANDGTPPAMQAVNIYSFGMFEQNYATYNAPLELRTLLDWKPTVLVVELGDNSSASLTSDEAKSAFATGFEAVLAAFKAESRPEIFVLSTFWPTPTTDVLLRQACANVGGVFVDISSLYGTAANRGGWGGHPSDAGMAAIADTVWGAMTTHSAPEPTMSGLVLCATISMALYACRRGSRRSRI